MRISTFQFKQLLNFLSDPLNMNIVFIINENIKLFHEMSQEFFIFWTVLLFLTFYINFVMAKLFTKQLKWFQVDFIMNIISHLDLSLKSSKSQKPLFVIDTISQTECIYLVGSHQLQQFLFGEDVFHVKQLHHQMRHDGFEIIIADPPPPPPL